MENERLISIRHVCTLYNVEPAFIESLREYGLIEVMKLEEEECIERERVAELELLIHLHYDLEINFEGIDAISHLLGRVRDLQKELIRLRNSQE